VKVIRGNAHRFGANVDTDVIIPARYLTTTDPEELGKHCMEVVDPEFVDRVRPGDLIVAEQNFGSGSSREHAPIAIKAAGISCVIASTFARIFFRNAINVGLPAVECPEIVAVTESGDEIELDLAGGMVRNLTKSVEARAKSFPDFMRELLDAGGLVPYLSAKLTGASREAALVAPATGPREADLEHD
jgi:3-isopropylmalate/(R)-2-methylmalate dehydratase small subunit